MVTHDFEVIKKVVKGFNRFSKFILLGNNIDGFVSVDFQEFDNFQLVIEQLPDIVKNLDYRGEWDLRLFQVPKDYTIDILYGYYKVPSKGTMIFELTYMMVGDENSVILSNSLVQFICKSFDAREKWDEDEHLEFEIMEEHYTFFLKERINGKKYKNIRYPGDFDELLKWLYKR